MPEFWTSIAALEQHYGKLKPPVARGPFELVLYEICGYLAPEDQREAAFRELKNRVGLRPDDLLKAKKKTLAEIAAIGGIFPDLRAERFQKAAQLVRDEFRNDLRSVLKMEPAKARRALAKFPMIGEPGTEKILLLCGRQPALAPESNGLRVLVRLGLVKEDKSYSKMYRDARTALRDVIGSDCATLVSAHLMLKRHGQELCRRSAPRCGSCPLRSDCPSRVAGARK